MTRLAALLLVLLMPAVAGAQLMAFRGFDPAPPTEYQPPTLPATLAGLETGATVITPVDSAELDSLINDGGTVDGTTLAAAAAAGPVVIKLDASASRTVPYSGWYDLPDLDNADWIYIVSDEYDSLPASGTRVQTADRTNMVKCQPADNDAAAIYWYGLFNVLRGAEKYRFIGLECSYPAGADVGLGLINCSAVNYTLTYLPYVSSEADIAHDIIVDRCELYGRDVSGQEESKAIVFNVINGAVLDSSIHDIAGTTSDDPQGIIVSDGRVLLFENNSISASGECFILGGADGFLDHIDDVVVRGNYMWKPLEWDQNLAEYDSYNRACKNIFELKKAQRVLVEGNVFEHTWSDAQGGTAVLMTVRNQDGDDLNAIVSDINFRNNIIRNVTGAIAITGEDDLDSSQQTQRLKITNNIFEDVTREAGNIQPIFFQFSTPDRPARWVTIANNTCLTSLDEDGPYGHLRMQSATICVDELRVTDNIMLHGDYNTTWDRTANATLSGNVLAMMPDNSRYATNVSNFATYYPTGFSMADPGVAAIGFVNAAGGDYRLDVTSDYIGTGAGGADPGIDQDELEAATSGAITGTW